MTNYAHQEKEFPAHAHTHTHTHIYIYIKLIRACLEGKSGNTKNDHMQIFAEVLQGYK